MARKVFISVLGTGYYEACKYIKGSFCSTETRFIQQATLEYLKVCNNWVTKNADGEVVDRIIILLTDGAKDTNWHKNITKRFNSKTETEEPYEGLEQILDNMHLPCLVETLSIPDGKSEDEMWTIFNTVYNALKPNDELYFDLTHSFRYLPMLVLVLGNYAKFLKGVKVNHISYGNYEARNAATNEAPLMDILPLTMLQDWTFAAADLIQNGNIKKLQELKENNALVPLLRERGKKNIDRRMAEGYLDGYIQSLNNFLNDMKLCQGPNILKGETINKINDCHEQVVEVFENVIAPIPPVINKIQDSLLGFEQTDSLNPESLRNGYMAAKWCYDHQLYQQSITILDENLTTHFCKYLGTNEFNYDQRNCSNAFLRNGGYREEDWKKKKKDEEVDEGWEKIKEVVKDAETYQVVQDFVSLMSIDAKWIHNKRNSYNHASMTNDKMFTTEDVKILGEKIQRILTILR